MTGDASVPFSVNLLNGVNGFKVAVAGASVVLAGDFNHDGFADLAIGSPNASAGARTEAGQTHVVFGRATYANATILESEITGTTGFVINGVATSDASGWALAYVDINGDGFDDLVIGAPFVDVGATSGSGSAYVVYGTATPPAATFELTALDGGNGFVLTGDPIYPGYFAGYSLSGIGDFNQDGRDDLLIGSPFPGSFYGPEESHAYVLYGAPGFGASIPLASLTGTVGVTYTGYFQDETGRDVAGVGDVNGDGRPDLLYTQYFGSSVGIPGRPVYANLFFGPPGAAVEAPVHWSIDDDGDPIDASGAGDFNGDGIDDIIMTYNGTNFGPTAAVVYGRSDRAWGSSPSVDGGRGLILGGPAGSQALVASAGDFNGDGFDDVIVGVGGSAYIVFGSPVPRTDLDIRSMTPSQGLAISDVGTNPKVNGAGDVNGDGFDDVAITSALGTFVVFGFSVGVIAGTGGGDTLNGTSGDEQLQGLGGNDHLIALGGNDVLNGGTGADTMEGGAGSDVYYVDNVGDVVVETTVGEGDSVFASVSYTLPAGAAIEALHAWPRSGTDPLNLTGNELVNVINGNQGVNFLRGGGGNDALFGFGGNDFLIGDAGSDAMSGGAGDDTYYVDNPGDAVLESDNEGTDRVAASVSYVLTDASSVERLEAITLSSTDAINLAGNMFGQAMLGNEGVNVLYGMNGNDALYGFGGNDYLIGGSGDDAVYGGLGDDTYYVDSFGDANDVIVELAGEGRDRIATSITYALAASMSIEVLEATNSTSTNAMNLTGNGLDNVIGGNNGLNTLRGGDGNDTLGGYNGADMLFGENGDDVLIGGAGNDTMSGGDGSDTYYVDSPGDILIDPVAPGVDRVAALLSYTLGPDADIETLEAITLSATDALNFTGNGFGQTIVGNNGANTIDGKGGIDVLVGAGGADIFAFTTGLGSFNVDRIGDFLSGTDRIALDDAVFTGLTPGALPAGAFAIGSQAGDADDRIVYNSATGELFFDADGSGAGAAMLFATLDGHPPLAASDIIVI
jgi:Ca2+-binding RTX toxin-like protein